MSVILDGVLRPSRRSCHTRLWRLAFWRFSLQAYFTKSKQNKIELVVRPGEASQLSGIQVALEDRSLRLQDVARESLGLFGQGNHFNHEPVTKDLGILKIMNRLLFIYSTCLSCWPSSLINFQRQMKKEIRSRTKFYTCFESIFRFLHSEVAVYYQVRQHVL